jgi:uncharacterized membrane protein YqjE
MKIDWPFLRIVAVCYAAAALLAAYPVSEFATPSVMRSVVAGAVMSLVNVVLGYLSIEVAFDKSHTTFLKFVLGGMVGRLLLMWVALLVLVRFFDYHTASLMLTLLFFYVLNLVLEIAYLQKRVQSRQ